MPVFFFYSYRFSYFLLLCIVFHLLSSLITGFQYIFDFHTFYGAALENKPETTTI